jgi:hypothetical protein
LAPPADWRYGTTGATRGVLKNVGDVNWALLTSGNSGSAELLVTVSASATGTNTMTGGASTTVQVVASATGAAQDSGGGGALLSNNSFCLLL